MLFDNPLKLSELCGIRANIKVIKIIMEKFQSQSKRCLRYTVHSIQCFNEVHSIQCFNEVL